MIRARTLLIYLVTTSTSVSFGITVRCVLFESHDQYLTDRTLSTAFDLLVIQNKVERQLACRATGCGHSMQRPGQELTRWPSARWQTHRV